MAQHKQQKQASDLEPEASLLRGPEHLDAAVEPTQPYMQDINIAIMPM